MRGDSQEGFPLVGKYGPEGAKFVRSALPLYTAMWVSQSVRIRQQSTQPLLRPGWRQVAVHVYALPSTALQ